MGNFFEDLIGKTGQDKQEANIKKSETDFERILSFLQGQSGEARSLHAQRLAEIVGGFRNARANAERSGDAAKRSARDAGQQATSSAAQSLVNRGLGNTTVLESANRGIAADTSRRVQEIDSTLAGVYAGLDTQEAAAKASVLGDQANFELGLSQLFGGTLTDRVSFRSGIQYGGGFLGDILNAGAKVGAAALI